MSNPDLDSYAAQLHNGTLDGHGLKELVDSGVINKGERRKIAKLAEKLKKIESLTPRQKLRLEVKQKKAQPKITREERKKRYHEQLDAEREAEQAKFTICLGCRKRGHFVKDCPKLSMIDKQKFINSDPGKEVCFNCGSNDHTLKNCPHPRSDNKLAYATCFICKKEGHISRDCPQNGHGLYPNGGCCHICQLRTHLARDCPDKPKEEQSEQKEDDGVSMKGLVATENLKGDEVLLDDFNVDNDSDSDSEEEKKQKKKKSKKSKK